MPRAAVGGNIGGTSSVAVKTMLMTSSWSTPLRASISRSRAWTRSLSCSSVSASSVVAPRRARTAGGTPRRYRPRQRLTVCSSTSGTSILPRAGDGRLLQAADLGRRELPPPARAQAAVGDGADPRADEADRGEPDRFAHAADLAVAAFVDRQSHGPRWHGGGPGRGGDTVLQRYAR